MSTHDIFNEYLLTRLRTNIGGYFDELMSIDKNLFETWHRNYLLFNKNNLIKEKDNNFYVAENDWIILDYILKEIIV